MKPFDSMSCSEILYTIATASEDAQNEFFRLLRQEDALTEDDVLNIMMAVSSLRLMMNKELKDEMGTYLYNYFINRVNPGKANKGANTMVKDFKKTKLANPVTITDVVKLAEDYYRVEFLINNRFWGCQLFSDATMMPAVPNWRERLEQIHKGDKMCCWKTRIYDSAGSYNLYNLIPERWNLL